MMISIPNVKKEAAVNKGGGGRGSWRYRDLFDAGLYEAEEDDELCTTEEESSDDEFEIVFD